MKDNVEQLGPFKTYMSLIKGFVCTGCLYYPRNVIEGGWGFIIMAMLLSCVLTMYCGKLLLDLRKKLKPKSYTDIGMQTYGRVGRIAVDIALALSQTGFCCAYVYFIKNSLYQIMSQAFDLNLDSWVFYLPLFILFSLLCFVRKI